MEVLDRAAFSLAVSVLGLRIKPTQCGVFMKRFMTLLLNIPKKRNIVSCSAPGHKVLLLNSRFSRLDLSEMPAEDALFARSNGAVPVHHDLVFDYDHWTADQVLKAVLPSSLDEVTTSFSTVGHIAHMNLRDEQL